MGRVIYVLFCFVLKAPFTLLHVHVYFLYFLSYQARDQSQGSFLFVFFSSNTSHNFSPTFGGDERVEFEGLMVKVMEVESLSKKKRLDIYRNFRLY